MKNWVLGGPVGPGIGHKVLPLVKGLSCYTRTAVTALTPCSAGRTEVGGIAGLSSVFCLHTCPQHCCFFSYLSLPSRFILFSYSISSLCAGAKHVWLSHFWFPFLCENGMLCWDLSPFSWSVSHSRNSQTTEHRGYHTPWAKTPS